MFMQNSAEELSRPIGIQRARHASGRKRRIRLNDLFLELDCSGRATITPLVIIALVLGCCGGKEFGFNCGVADETAAVLLLVSLFLAKLEILILGIYAAVQYEKIGYKEFYTFIRLVFYEASGRIPKFFNVPIAAITVRALYAGPLVANQTTAPRCQSPFQSYPVLLAALCIILATLTIAARCYASTNTAQSIVQLSPNTSFSPIFIKYSNSQLHTSKIVLSRLFPNPLKYVQSDTSVIEANSKQLVYNQKPVYRRRKRDYDHTSPPSGHPSYHQKKYLRYHPTATYHRRPDASNFIPTDGRTRSNQIPYIQVLPTFKYSVDFPFDSKDDAGSAAHPPEEDPNEQPHGPAASSVNGGASAPNKSGDSSRVASTFVVDRENFDPTTLDGVPPSLRSGKKRPMPSAHDHDNNSLSENGVLVLVVAAVVLTVALGLVTCVLSHYRGGTAANPHDAAQTPTTAPMLSVVSAGATAGVGGMDRLRGRGAARELAASRDRQVRLHAVHTDIAINLPPSISLPDGEEHPFSSRLHIRDTEQESEIYQKCIRPPPNRTVLESESPPPYRSSSAGLLGSTGGSSSGSSDWTGGSAPLVVRCHSMSSTSKRPEAGGPGSSSSSGGQKTDFIQKTVKIFTGKKSQPSPAPTLPPVVIVPSRTRRTTTTTTPTTTTTDNSTGRPKPNV